MFRIAVLTAGFLAAILLAPAAAEETVCPEGSHAIYSAEDELVSCEVLVGTPTGCPEDAEPGYLEDGTLAGCFTSSVSTEELCAPVGVDTDGDMLDDGCDPCPENADCDGDGFCDGLEVHLGTDPLAACPDGPSHDAWPLDNNMDGFVTLVPDMLAYRQRMNTTGGPPADPMWLQRLDLNADNYITIVPELLYFRGHLGASCAEAGEVAPLSVIGCWACMEWPVGTLDLHIHGEFNWTIPLPWPLPDLVDTKYEMHMFVSFTWLNQFNIAGLGHTSAWAEADSPYYIVDDPTITGDPSGDLSSWNVEARAVVEVFPWISNVAYPVSLWINFWVPGIWNPGGSGFHYWWAHVE